MRTVALLVGSWLVGLPPVPALAPVAQPGGTVGAEAHEAVPEGASAAAAATATSSNPDSAGRPPEFFAERWLAWRNAREAKDQRREQTTLDEIVTAKEESGWPNFFVYARVLALDSEAAAREQNIADAVRFATAAVRLAPDAPGSHAALASAHWVAGSYVDGVVSLFRALVVSLTEPPLLRIRLGNALLALVVGLLVTTIIFAFSCIFRYARSAIHDLRHLLPAGASSWHAGTLGAAILAAPFLFRLGFVWVALVWVVALAFYYAPRERVAAILALSVLAVVPLTLPELTSYWGYAGSRGHDVYRVARALDAGSALERIRARAEPTADEQLALGLRAHWSGDSREAANRLRAAAAAGRDDPELFALLGNVYFALGQRTDAIAAYERAAKLEPDSLVALFNMSRVYFAMGEPQKGNEAYRKASAIDYELADVFAKKAKSAGRGYVMPVGAPRRLLAIGPGSQAVHERAVEQLWRWVGADTPRLYFSAVAILAVLAVALLALVQRSFPHAVACRRCGMPACKRCAPELPDLGQCGTCYHAFDAGKPSQAQLRIQKEIAVHRHQASTTRLRRLFSVLMAGGGHLSHGATLRGMAFLAVFATALTTVLATVGILPVPANVIDVQLDRFTAATAGVVALLAYGISLWDGARER